MKPTINFHFPRALAVNILTPKMIEELGKSWNKLRQGMQFVPNYMARAQERLELLKDGSDRKDFPYAVVIKADHYDLDIFDEILWSTLGPAHGECNKISYALEDKTWFCPGVWVDTSYEPINYPHSHYGIWTYEYIAKVGYDLGMQVFYFKNLHDLEDFKIKIQLGPQYEIIGE